MLKRSSSPQKNPHPAYESLIQHIKDLEEEAHHLKSQLRLKDKELSQAHADLQKFSLQARTSQTLNLGLFTTLEANQIYSLVCESLVAQIGWEWAMALTLHGKRPEILASYGVQGKQVNHITDYLGLSTFFLDDYNNHVAICTYPLQPNKVTQVAEDRQALALRTLFQTQELVAVPVLFADRLFAYLIVGTHEANKRLGSLNDINFLANLSAQVAHALENSGNYTSLEEQNQKLRHLDELKDSFISITSHQLRTPLSIIKWILSIVVGDPAIVALPEQVRLLNQAYDSNERLIHVVNDLLNVSRLQEGRLPYDPQPIPLHQILDDIQSSAQTACANKNLRLELDIAEELPTLSLDPIIFREALQNIVDNAVDYNQPNGYIRLRAYAYEEKAFIAISNSGLGIAPEEQKKIYDQFYRSPEAVKQQPSGNGLGLFLTQAIVHQHGGQIICESQPGQETTFTIVLPIEAPRLPEK